MLRRQALPCTASAAFAANIDRANCVAGLNQLALSKSKLPLPVASTKEASGRAAI
jgi:hypothetical protein